MKRCLVLAFMVTLCGGYGVASEGDRARELSRIVAADPERVDRGALLAELSEQWAYTPIFDAFATLSREAHRTAINGFDGPPPFMLAAQKGHTHIVRFLLQLGAKVNGELKERSNGRALHLASEGGHTSVVALLLRAGAEVDAQTVEGSTALHLAAAGGHLAALHVLLHHGADRRLKNDDGYTAAEVAQSNNHSAVASALYQKRARE